MSILIKTVRIAGFRGLENIEVSLEQTTILTGMNNSGKTSFLKALQLALGSRQFVSQDDFFIQESSVSDNIIIDLLIVPTNSDGEQCETFSENWEELFLLERIKSEDDVNFFVPLRTIITSDELKSSYKTQHFILQSWPEFKQEGLNWFDADDGKDTSFHFDGIPFFYMDAQRDILDDMKLRSSYLGKMLSKIKYSEEATEKIEYMIKLLNDEVVSDSDILLNIKKTLEELDTAMGTHSEGVEITPFAKKVRDLNKSLSIYYADQQDSFSMEYHGMGTRSWSSLLTLKSFISLLSSNAQKYKYVFFPILAVEEPEAHLHPNAQKKLFRQIDVIAGQKIISTHSPYIAAEANLKQVRNFYKYGSVTCSKIDINNLNSEEIRKINRQVINTRGEIYFSKMIIFVEGETEEQALPILAKKYFDKTSAEMGLDFIGVGGYNSYLPFLKFAEAFKIPWLIFSDAESKSIKDGVQSQFIACGSEKKESDCIVFLDDGNDFEKQLISDGVTHEIKQAIASVEVYVCEQHKIAKETERWNVIKKYGDDELYKIITANKTQFGPAVAEQIVQSDKELPPKVIELFNKIAVVLKIGEVKYVEQD